MSEIFREIEDEIRRDNLGKLWARYGVYVIGLVIAILIATAGFTGWRWYQDRQARAASVQYAAALDLVRKNEIGKATDALSELSRTAGSGQATLARLEMAALRAKAGDTKAAIGAYRGIAEDSSVNSVYRDVATLLGAFQQLDSTDPKTVIAEVQNLTTPGNPWRPTALEITALADLRAGDKVKARDVYKGLADDLTAPQGLRARAAEMVAALAE